MTAAHRHALLAPGASPPGSARAPGRGESLPAVDERLVAPESRFEAVDGVLIETMGANEAHATANGELVFVLRAVAKTGFRCAVDMLTRADRYSDVAPDASIFPEERAPGGGRQLEQLVFEVRDTQPLSDVTRKAELLATRGVRRIFCLEVPAGRVLEWGADGWRALPGESVIEDDILAAPLPVRALVSAADADNTAAQALLAKRNPVVERALSRSREEGREEGREQGHASGLAPFVHLLQRRLGRSLTEDELTALRRRLLHLAPERTADLLELALPALEAWLSDVTAT